jgi:hypothetical protein
VDQYGHDAGGLAYLLRICSTLSKHLLRAAKKAAPRWAPSALHKFRNWRCRRSCRLRNEFCNEAPLVTPMTPTFSPVPIGIGRAHLPPLWDVLLLSPSPLYPSEKGSYLWQHWFSGLDNFLVEGLSCIMGYLAVSLTSTHEMPVAPRPLTHSNNQKKKVFRLPNVPHDKIAPGWEPLLQMI